MTYPILSLSKTLFALLPVFWKEYEKRIQKSSTLLSTQRLGGIQIIAGILRSIGHPSILRIGSSSKKQSSALNIPSLTSRFRKSLTGNGIHRNS